MNAKEYSEYLDHAFRANLTLLIWGKHGIGKSTIPEQYAEAGGHRLFNLRLGNMEIGDLLGLQDFKEEGDDYKGKKTKRVATSFMPPDWLHELIKFAEANPDKYAIIFLDEINRVRKDMLNPVFQIALDKKLHTFKFPPNVRVIAAANPPIDDENATYWVNDFTESALLDRFCHLHFNPSVQDWVEFARSHDVNADVVGFVSDQPAQLHSVNVGGFSVDQYCKPSPRSWIAAATLLKQEAPKEMIYGCIGTSTGAAFYTWLEENRAKRVAGEDVMKNYDEVQKRVKDLIARGRIGELKTTLNEIEAVCKAKSETGPEYDLETGTNIARFLNDLPIDVAYKSTLELCTYNAICRQISTVDDDDKRAGLDHQKQLIKRLKEALESGKIDRSALDGDQKKGA